MSSYADQEYWQNRYRESGGETYEWLQKFDGIQPILTRFEGKFGGKVLIVGCGNSSLSEDMHEFGFRDIVSIDTSSVAIEHMRARAAGQHSLRYEVMDARCMTFEDQSFDLVVDKGTMDALYCSREKDIDISRATSEIFRVLKPGGDYLVISYGEPERRLAGFGARNWDISIETLEDEDGPHMCHFCYICHKKGTKLL